MSGDSSEVVVLVSVAMVSEAGFVREAWLGLASCGPMWPWMKHTDDSVVRDSFYSVIRALRSCVFSG